MYVFMCTGPGDEGINHFQVSQEEDEKLKEIEEKLYLLQTDRELHSEVIIHIYIIHNINNYNIKMYVNN